MDYYDTVKIPTWAIGYIEYDDCSGISESDIFLISDYLDALPSGVTFSFHDSEPYFAYRNAIDDRGADVIDTDLYIPSEV